MRSIFQKKINGNLTIAEILMKPINETDNITTVIDVGARNGMTEDSLPMWYANFSRINGFEPNEEEYKKLINNETDALKAGESLSRFKEEKYFNCAIWSAEMKRQFYITVGAGSCTLMGSTLPHITNKIWLDGTSKPFTNLYSEVIDNKLVQCKTLDQLFNGENIIDYLKIDVEGGELDVLLGAEKLLSNNRILFIKSEFILAPIYEKSNLLGHQQVLLDKYNYRMIGFDLNHSKYSRGESKMPSWADNGLVYAGDAFYILDPERCTIDKFSLHRLGVISLAMNFNNLGLSLLRDAKLLDKNTIDLIEMKLSSAWTSKRIKNIWLSIPRAVKSFLRI
jgi:FkbM family methyltransferase